MEDVSFIYVTHPDVGGASALGRALVEQGLAACVNILPGMQTVYRWQGAIETCVEAVMIIKTRTAMFEPVASLVRARHPYDCPCIVALPIAEGDRAYLDWVRSA